VSDKSDKKENKAKWLVDFEKRLEEKERLYPILFQNLKDNLPELEKYLDKIMRTEGDYEGKVYRFYHFSFKVYLLQKNIDEIVKLLQKVNPNTDKKLCAFFEEIIEDARRVGGWEIEHNKNWTRNTRPIVEAFFHAKYMLEMAVSCGKEYSECPKQMIQQKWASILELYNLR
jgi:hypothetical protein